MSDYKTDPLLKDAVFEKLPTRNTHNIRRQHVADFRQQVDFFVFGVNMCRFVVNKDINYINFYSLV